MGRQSGQGDFADVICVGGSENSPATSETDTSPRGSQPASDQDRFGMGTIVLGRPKRLAEQPKSPDSPPTRTREFATENERRKSFDWRSAAKLEALQPIAGDRAEQWLVNDSDSEVGDDTSERDRRHELQQVEELGRGRGAADSVAGIPRVLQALFLYLRIEDTSDKSRSHVLKLLVLEMSHLLSNTLEDAGFLNALERQAEVLPKVRVFLLKWEEVVRLISRSDSSRGKEVMLHLLGHEDELLPLSEDIAQTINGMQLRPTPCMRVLQLLQPPRGDAAQVRFTAVLMVVVLLAAAVNAVLCAVALAEQGWVAAAVAAVFGAALCGLYYWLRESASPRVPAVVLVLVLSVSYHQLLLPAAEVPPELFAPFWLVAVVMERHPLPWHVGYVALRWAAMAGFAAARSAVTDYGWPSAAAVTLQATLPVVVGAGCFVARALLTDVSQPLRRSVLMEHYYRTLCFKSLISFSGMRGRPVEKLRELDRQVHVLRHMLLPCVDQDCSLEASALSVPPHKASSVSSRATHDGVFPQSNRRAIESALKGLSKLSTNLCTLIAAEKCDAPPSPLVLQAERSHRTRSQTRSRREASLPLSPRHNDRGSGDRNGMSRSLLGRSVRSPQSSTNMRLVGVGGRSIYLAANGVMTTMPVVALDKDLTITFWNERLASVTGIPAESAAGKSILTFVLDCNDQERVEIATLSAIEGQATSPGVFHFTTEGGGGTASFVLGFEPCFAGPDDTEAVGVVGAGKDLGIEQCAMDYSKWLYSEVKASTTALDDHIRFLADEGDDDGKLQLLLRHSKVLQATLDRFQPLCNPECGAVSGWKPLDIRLLCGKIASEFRQQAAERGNKLVVDISGELAHEVYSDQARLSKAVAYLVYNANRFTEAGTITLSASKRQKHEASGSGVLVLSVSDTGSGISDRRCKDIFSAFRKRSHQSGRASGFGLPKLSVVIRQMGGVVECQSEKRVGSTFTVTLPYLPVPESSLLADPPHIQNGGAFTSLLLETSPAQRNAFCHHLWQRRHAVTVVMDEAQIQTINLDCIEVCVTEIDTPVGRSMLEAVQRHSRGIFVIATAERFTEAQLDAASSGGLFSCLVKPVRASMLRATLDRVEQAVIDGRTHREKIEQMRQVIGAGGGCKWERGDRIGKGAFASVFLARNLLTGGVMAVKEMSITGRTEEELQSMLDEIKLLFDLSHPNIVHYFYCERTDSDLLIFMEYVDGGSLQEQIGAQGSLDSDTTAACCSDIFHGLEFLHAKKVVHRDIKSANVLLSRVGGCRLSDFGCAVALQDGVMQTSFKGTPSYMSPETINQTGIDQTSDVWAAGVMTYEMRSGTLPWRHVVSVGGGWMKIANHIGGLQPGKRVPLCPHSSIAGLVEDFIHACVRVEAAERCTAQEALRHEFITTADVFNARFKWKDKEAEAEEVAGSNSPTSAEAEVEWTVTSAQNACDDWTVTRPAAKPELTVSGWAKPELTASGSGKIGQTPEAEGGGSSPGRRMSVRSSLKSSPGSHRGMSPGLGPPSPGRFGPPSPQPGGLFVVPDVLFDGNAQPLEGSCSTVNSASSRASSSCSSASSLINMIPRSNEVDPTELRRRRSKGPRRTTLPRIQRSHRARSVPVVDTAGRDEL
eukprot:TRINITY_DN2918_c2_g2_i1.p1 TRINITY_DN2918_c2_g2~~TRINITY_DN2918_c2_g2_i1.p1  ORF type:complete len:1617 (+),score=555.53 TRINITY_DN2918_c2_g2_i1:49-4899(+)